LIILFVAKDFSRFSALVTRLRRQLDIELLPAPTGAAGLALLNGKPMDVVIVDEQLDDMSGIDFVKQVVKANPLVNTAIVSTLPADAFHETTEGLGVLMQLPAYPREADAEALLAVLEKIGALMQPVEQQPQEAQQSQEATKS
jgi:DNA-binding NarL/FixJ family response regulator